VAGQGDRPAGIEAQSLADTAVARNPAGEQPVDLAFVELAVVERVAERFRSQPIFIRIGETPVRGRSDPHDSHTVAQIV
jgi:hypothetical protein